MDMKLLETMINDPLIYKYLKRSSLDSFQSVKKCSWNGKNIDCEKIFFNKMNDFTLVFSFNIDRLGLQFMEDIRGEIKYLCVSTHVLLLSYEKKGGEISSPHP